YVGTSAFAHKGGMHVDAVVKNSQTFEHITPESVGNKSNFLISEVGGKSAVLSIVNEIDSTITKSSPQLAKILEELKKLEFKGYIFETATASLELLIRRKLCVMTDFFELVDYKLISEHSTANNMKNSVATVQITSNSQTAIATKSGDGPVHALDNALRQAVQNFFPTVKNMHLVDYKVRVIEPQAASAAMVRVLVESTDGETSWTTVGVSKDIIRASFYAIKDSVLYKLVKDSITKKNN
ncbi:MAG: alpha-isopropylmalate synthase regulatory domain-containing protein, partial [Oscillospiraceae bacterium]